MAGPEVPMLPGPDPVPTDALPVVVPIEVEPFGYRLNRPLANPYVPLGTPTIPEGLICISAPLARAFNALMVGSAIWKRLVVCSSLNVLLALVLVNVYVLGCLAALLVVLFVPFPDLTFLSLVFIDDFFLAD